MSSFINIEYKNFIVLLLSLLMVSCSGFEFEGADDSNVRSYPVSITAAAGANTRISLDDIALSWDQNDTLKITAVSSDGSYAVSDFTIYQIDQYDATSL